MWKRLSILLLVSVLAVSSAFAYPAWVYGKTKESTQNPSEETMQEAPGTLSIQESKSLKKDSKESLTQLKAYLKESGIEEQVVAEISRYVEQVEDGIEVMTKAYENEVKNHEQTQANYNALAEDYAAKNGTEYVPRKFSDDLSCTINPFVSFAPFSQEFGIGASVGVGYKDFSLTLGVMNPSIKSVQDIKNTDNILFTAGIGFSF